MTLRKWLEQADRKSVTLTSWYFLLQTAAPGVFAFISAAFLTRYRLTGKQLEAIQLELKARDEGKLNPA